MNDPSPSIHTSTEPPSGSLQSPEVPISPCRAVPTCPFCVSSTMSPQGTPSHCLPLYQRPPWASVVQACRWSLMESAQTCQWPG